MWSWFSRSALSEFCPVDHNPTSAEEIATHAARYGRAEKYTGDASATGSGCPVDHENMSKEDIAAFMEKHRGEANIAPAPATERAKPSICPVDHESMSNDAVAKYMVRAAGRERKLDRTDEAKPVQYDVYGQEIDPANMMPATPNQVPSPGQETRLSTDRVSSSIPKAETDSTWTYPSPQMFYNALKRKGKADDVDEADMESVVAIHNSMNEGTWEEVLEWERRFHCDECSNPTLRRFRGRPHDLSPAARFRTLFRGYPAPFDRHDWVVDRCGKEDVRYIIDYYYREQTDGNDGPIEIHVRPALDSPGAAWDRIRSSAARFQSLFPGSGASGGGDLATMPAAVQGGKAGTDACKPSSGRTIADDEVNEEEFTFLRSLTPEKIEEISESVKKDCAKIGLALAQSKSDPEAYEKANIALNYCMASKVCKPQAAVFLSAMEASSGSEPAAYTGMTACLDRFHIMARRVMAQASGVAQTGPERT
jgi:cytochrome c heme-lyase